MNRNERMCIHIPNVFSLKKSDKALLHLFEEGNISNDFFANVKVLSLITAYLVLLIYLVVEILKSKVGSFSCLPETTY